jgi:hypothetical protein
MPLLEQLKRHPIVLVRKWARDTLSAVKKHIAADEAREQEQMLGAA